MIGVDRVISSGWIAYNTSKSAVLQMGRSMACELGKHGIRVNTLSPGQRAFSGQKAWSTTTRLKRFSHCNLGHIRTAMTARYLDNNPDLEAKWASMNPLGRIGSPHELRGVVSWLASDASTFCTGSEWVLAVFFISFSHCFCSNPTYELEIWVDKVLALSLTHSINSIILYEPSKSR
jgi:NAD(P)-dependent dehydrogenase (short-subunit alcohol dehydrogenase family)